MCRSLPHDSQIFLGGSEPTTLKELTEALGKETIDTFNTSDTRGNSPSYGTNYQKLGKELLNQIVNAFPVPLSFRGLEASSGTVEMAYGYADGQQGHIMRQLAFTPEN